MNPKDLLIFRLREGVLSHFESWGFRFLHSKPQFIRTVGYARQKVHFALSKWNRQDDCTFWTLWEAESPLFAKWYRAEWGESPPNAALGGLSDWNIPGWTRGVGNHFHLKNTKEDEAEMVSFLENVKQAGLPFLDSISTWVGAAEHLQKHPPRMFDRIADFYILAGKPDQARSVLTKGIHAFEEEGRRDNVDELSHLRARLNKYFSTAIRNGEPKNNDK